MKAKKFIQDYEEEIPRSNQGLQSLILHSSLKKGITMTDNQLLDKIISLTEDVVKLKIENERLKIELKHERELNKFRNEFPNKI